jgi:CBS domain containing-hemolysin-like protein
LGSYNSKPRSRPQSRRNSWFTALKLAIATFTVTVAVTLPAQQVVRGLNPLVSLAVIIVIILLGILFDILGVAVAAAEEKPFHAMSAKRVRGAKQALRMIRNADTVASFSNDLIGDIAGTVSGAATASLVFQLARLNPGINDAVAGVAAVGLAASLTVGGKAVGKRVAINQSTGILLRAGRALDTLERILHWRVLNGNTRGNGKRKGR